MKFHPKSCFIQNRVEWLNKGGKNGNEISTGAFNTVAFTSSTINDAYRNFNHSWYPSEDTSNSQERWCGSAAPGNIRSSTWTNCIDNTYVTWPATIRPVPKTLIQEKN